MLDMARGVGWRRLRRRWFHRRSRLLEYARYSSLHHRQNPIRPTRRPSPGRQQVETPAPGEADRPEGGGGGTGRRSRSCIVGGRTTSSAACGRVAWAWTTSGAPSASVTQLPVCGRAGAGVRYWSDAPSGRWRSSTRLPTRASLPGHSLMATSPPGRSCCTRPVAAPGVPARLKRPQRRLPRPRHPLPLPLRRLLDGSDVGSIATGIDGLNPIETVAGMDVGRCAPLRRPDLPHRRH